MNNHAWIRPLFYLAGAYDGLLGLAFLLFPLAIYDHFEIMRPNHIGYVQFPAALLLIFGLMFVNIGRRPTRQRNLIPYGILLKLSYCLVIFGHWFTSGLPNLWKPFAVCDACFALLFLWAYVLLGTRAPAAATNGEQ